MQKTASVLLMAGLLGAAGADAADLLSVYRDSVVADAPFAAAKSAVDAGREQLPQGRAGLLPNLSISANTVWNNVDANLRSGYPSEINPKYNSNGWTATLTQPLFRWENWSSYRQSEFAVAQAEAQFVQAKQDLILRVAQAYFDVVLAEDTLTTNRAQKAAIAEQLASAKRNFEVGTTTITDTHEAQARYDLATAQEIAAESDLQVKRQSLRAIIGKEPEPLKHLKADAQLGPPQPDDINKWSESAERDSPAVASAQASMEIADREVDKQRAGHFPTVDFIATRGRTSEGFSFNTYNGAGLDITSTTVGVQATLPIFSGGATQSRYNQAVALREKARADVDNARRQAVLGARQAYLGVSSGLAQVKALEQALMS